MIFLIFFKMLDFPYYVLMGSQQCRRVFFSHKKLKLSYFVYTQFWLNLVMDDDHHFDYITKLEKKTLTKNIPRSFWLPSESQIFFGFIVHMPQV
jgi:hypothetical protein